MNPQRERAREHFPAVLLGVLGIIQALALEILWENGVGGIDRWRAIDAAAAGWLQTLAIFLGIIVVWLMYAMMVLRYAWVPRFYELVFPFVLGALEFLLIELTAPARISWFFAALGLVFVIAPVSTFRTFQLLIRQGDVPDRPLREQLRGYRLAIASALALFLCAGLSAAAGPVSAVVLACLAAANVGLLLQIASFRHFWRLDVEG